MVPQGSPAACSNACTASRQLRDLAHQVDLGVAAGGRLHDVRQPARDVARRARPRTCPPCCPSRAPGRKAKRKLRLGNFRSTAHVSAGSLSSLHGIAGAKGAKGHGLATAAGMAGCTTAPRELGKDRTGPGGWTVLRAHLAMLVIEGEEGREEGFVEAPCMDHSNRCLSSLVLLSKPVSPSQQSSFPMRFDLAWLCYRTDQSTASPHMHQCTAVAVPVQMMVYSRPLLTT